MSSLEVEKILVGLVFTVYFNELWLNIEIRYLYYLRMMLDDVFNSKNFRSEIIWKRSTAHSDTKQGRIQTRAA